MTNSASKVEVRTLKNGVVVHKHDGANGFHDPNRAHDRSTDLHDKIMASAAGKAAMMKPEGFDKLNKGEQDQYTATLRFKGQEGKTAWIYPVKKEAPATVPTVDGAKPEPELVGATPGPR